MTAQPAVMHAYDGQRAVRAIQDYGPQRGIRARLLNADGSSSDLGFYPTRKAAREALYAADEARKRQAEPAPAFASGLPK